MEQKGGGGGVEEMKAVFLMAYSLCRRKQLEFNMLTFG